MERFLRIFLSSFFWKYPSEQKHVRVNSKKDTGTASGLCRFTTGLRTQIFIKNRYKTLHKKSPCSELFWSLFFPYSDWIRRDTEHLSYSVRMRENAENFYAVRLNRLKSINFTNGFMVMLDSFIRNTIFRMSCFNITWK